MNRRRSLVWAAACLVTVVLAACGPSSDGPLLSDPREIVGRTIQQTAALKTVRIRFDFQQHSEPVGVNAPALPRDQGGWAELTADVGAQAVAVRGAGNDGQGQVEAVVLGGFVFVKNTVRGRWSKTAIPGGMGLNPIAILGGQAGQGAAVPIALAAALADPTVQAQLRGVEDCRGGRCYRTTCAIPPAVAWKLAMAVTGMDKQVGAQPQPQDGIPQIDIELLTDTRTFHLIEALAGGTSQGTTVRLRAQLAGHDEAVTIAAPNPALVDDQGGFGLGGAGSECMNADGSPCEIIDRVGSSIRPEPSP